MMPGKYLATPMLGPSRGHIKQLKDQLKNITQASQSITNYMQSIKTKADELATLGKSSNHEDLMKIISPLLMLSMSRLHYFIR